MVELGILLIGLLLTGVVALIREMGADAITTFWVWVPFAVSVLLVIGYWILSAGGDLDFFD